MDGQKITLAVQNLSECTAGQSEQEHRAIKRITRPMLGFKSFWGARIIIAGIETMHMIRKGQLGCPEGQTMSAAQQFYSLVA